MRNDVMVISLQTSGLPPAGIPLGDPQYPWMLEGSAEIFDFKGTDLGGFARRVIADHGRRVHPGATAVHGITTASAAREGFRETLMLWMIHESTRDIGFIAGYAIEFYYRVVISAVIRLEKEAPSLTRRGLQVIDLMEPAKAACKLPSNSFDGGYRWPKFEDAVEIILGERLVYDPDPRAVNTRIKARAAKRLFLHFHQSNMLDIEKAA